jgi:hypothetical protein
MDNEEKKIIGRIALSSTKCDLQEDGMWKAVSEIWDKVLYEGETEWTEEMVTAMSFDNDSQSAIQTAMGGTLNYLLQNVYNNGFKGLIEYRDYERKLKSGREAQSN